MQELVNIVMPAYNHEKYIAQAIEGVVMQKTNFSYKLLIGEDKSKDNTRDIIRKYEQKYPDKITVYYHDTNQGPMKNSLFLLKKCKAKYIALCEGDDYWTDENKLQKQVDFLEKNPDFAMCSHKVKIIYEDVEEKYPFVDPLKVADFDDIIQHGHFIPTLSILYRKKALPIIPEWFEKLWVGDIPLVIMITHYGKNYYIDEEMGVKRKHQTGLTQLSERRNEIFRKYCIKNKLFFYKQLNKFYKFAHFKTLRPVLGNFYIRVMVIHFDEKELFNSLYYFINAFIISPELLFKYFIKFLRDFEEKKWKRT